MVDAPSKRIAKWCGANLFNNEYIDFLSAKDMIAERFKVKGGEEYEKASESNYVNNPLAYALYQVWKRQTEKPLLSQRRKAMI